MSVSLTLGQGLTIGKGITFGAGSGGASFTISPSDFTNTNNGYGNEGDNTGFGIGGSHPAGEACYGAILDGSAGGSTAKSAEILAFWNAQGLTVNDNSYLFDVSWGPGSSTNTTRNVVVMTFIYNNPNSTTLQLGVVDTNVTGWDTPGQNPFSITAANGTFMLPATFTLIKPTIQDTYSWC